MCEEVIKTEKHYVDHNNVYNLKDCKGNGKHPIPNDPTRFYTCTRKGSVYEQRIYQCPQGKTYCPVTEECLKEPIKQVQQVSLK